MTHDYKRHGTTTLFDALNVLGGSMRGFWIAFAAVSNPRVPLVPNHGSTIKQSWFGESLGLKLRPTTVHTVLLLRWLRSIPCSTPGCST